jgi:O-antigen/teichoic acid export membrane protein
MQAIYCRLALGMLVLFGAVGTLAAIHPISMLASPAQGWTAWAIVVVATTLGFSNLTYTIFLQGTDRIAMLRRVEIVAALLSIASSVVVLTAGGGLVALAAATCVWPVAASEWIRRLCLAERQSSFSGRIGKVDTGILRDIWPAAWRSAVGILMSAGVIQASALLLAQMGTAAELASFLISLRVLQLLVTASQAPFYSKLPRLARLYAQGDRSQQLALASRGMALSYWSYAAGVVGIGVLAPALLRLVDSHAEFVARPLWFFMGVAFFVERYGAMHIQVYSLTNDIIWHKANGIAGAVFLLVLWLGYGRLGLYVFPTGILAGYLGFYSWYAASHSYRVLASAFWPFELRTSAVPAALLLFASVSAVLL